MIALCRQRFPDHAWVVGDMRQPPFDAGGFDAILTWDTLDGAARDGALPDHGDHLSRMATAVERDLASVQDDAPMVDVVDVSGHPSGSPDGEAAGHVLGEGGSVGAAAVHDSTLGQETLKGALGVERLPVVKHQDPLMRSLWSPSVVVRRIVQQLAETPLVLSKNPLALWSEKQVRELTSLSHNEIHRRRIAGTFPRPEPIGGRRVAYRASEVMDWLKNPTGWKMSQQDETE